MKLRHWQDVVNALLGVCLILSPWALGYDGMTMAMSNAVVIGLALIAAALGAIFVPRAWEEWTEGILGVWMLISPWMLDFAMFREAMLTAVVIGIAVAALALWTLFTDKEYSAWWHDKIAH